MRHSGSYRLAAVLTLAVFAGSCLTTQLPPISVLPLLQIEIDKIENWRALLSEARRRQLSGVDLKDETVEALDATTGAARNFLLA